MRQGIGSDSRIGYHFITLAAAAVVSCFPERCQALIRTAEQDRLPTELLQAVRAGQLPTEDKLNSFIKDYFGSDLKGKTFALWGLQRSSRIPMTCVKRPAVRMLMEQLWLPAPPFNLRS